MDWLYEKKLKRLDKLTEKERIELMFDLINAFGKVKGSGEAALLLQDLLTGSEIKNLAKRLRIAKLILAGKSQREIADELHCSFATITKVGLWLDQGGGGFERVIKRLPRKYDIPTVNRSRGIPIEFQGPQVLARLVQYGISKSQDKKVKRFIKAQESKRLTDKKLQEHFSDFYKKTK